MPAPLSPTSPTFSLTLILKLIPWRIQVSFQVGYQNQTSINSISPFKVHGDAIISCSFVFQTSIFEGSSIIVKIFFAASRPFTAEGPNYWAFPAAKAPNIMQKMHLNKSSPWNFVGYLSKIAAADQKRMQ